MIYMMFIFKFFTKAKDFQSQSTQLEKSSGEKPQFFANWKENLYPMIFKWKRAKIV
jgi:hypothetical protein